MMGVLLEIGLLDNDGAEETSPPDFPAPEEPVDQADFGEVAFGDGSWP